MTPTNMSGLHSLKSCYALCVIYFNAFMWPFASLLQSCLFGSFHSNKHQIIARNNLLNIQFHEENCRSVKITRTRDKNNLSSILHTTST